MRNVLAWVVLMPCLLLGASGNAAAQNAGNPTILAAVESVQSSLKSLKLSIAQIDSSVQGISAIQIALATLQKSIDAISQESQVNTRLTPPVDVAPPDLASCIATNVSAQPKNVQVQIVNLSGVVAENIPVGVLQPGTGGGGGNRTADFFYCKFTVVDGTRADIRGAMTVCTNSACKQTVAAE